MATRWHTVPVPEPIAVEEEDQYNEWVETESFYKQLVAQNKSKSNIATLARLLAKNHWLQQQEKLGDLRIRAEYAREFNGETEANVYVCVARLMTPIDILSTLEELDEAGPFANDPKSFFNVDRIEPLPRQLDHAGMPLYQVRGPGPAYPLRRMPSHFRAKANAGDPWEATGLDPTMHWGEEIDNAGRQLMACCGTPVQGRGANNGCWIKLDAMQDYGVIVPYAIMLKEDTWTQLAASNAFDSNALELSFASDVVTGTAFLDRGYYEALDRDIRAKWIALVPRLVDVYRLYMESLDHAIQGQAVRPSDPCQIHAPKGSSLWKDASVLYSLICQFNKPQEVCACYTDVKAFINGRLLKVELALENFNEKTRGFVMFGSTKINLLRGKPTVAQLDALLAAIVGQNTRLTGMVQNYKTFQQKMETNRELEYAQLMRLQRQLDRVKVDSLANAFQKLLDAYVALLDGINTGLREVSRGNAAGVPKDLSTTLKAADDRLVSAFNSFTQVEILIATAQKRVDDGLANQPAAFPAIDTAQDNVEVIIADAKGRIQRAYDLAPTQMESAPLEKLNAEIVSIEQVLAQLLLEANKQKLLLQEVGSMNNAAALTQVQLAVDAKVVAPLKDLLQRVKALKVAAVVNPIVVAVTARRTAEEQQAAAQQAADRDRLRKEKEARDLQEKVDRARLLKEAEQERLRKEAEAKETERLRLAKLSTNKVADAAASIVKGIIPKTSLWLADPDHFFSLSNSGLSQDRGLAALTLVSEPQKTALIQSKILLANGSWPKKLEATMANLAETPLGAYANTYFGDVEPAAQSKADIVNVWTKVHEWMSYRGTAVENDKWAELSNLLPLYSSYVPSQPMQVQRQLSLPHKVASHENDFAAIKMPAAGGMVNFNRILFKGNSCWIDSAFLALFSYPRNKIAQKIMSAKQAVRYVKRFDFADGRSLDNITDCNEFEMQELHEAIVEDILQLQSDVPVRPTCSLVSRLKWDKCVLVQPKAGGHNFSNGVFESLKVLYELDELEIGPAPSAGFDGALSFPVEPPVLVDAKVMVHVVFTGYEPGLTFTSVNVEVESNASLFVLGAVLSYAYGDGDKGHYVTNLRDFFTQQWTFIDVEPSGKKNIVTSLGSDLPDSVNSFSSPYKPYAYVYFRKSMLVDLIKQKPTSNERTVAIVALDGILDTADVDTYKQALKAITPNTDYKQLEDIVMASTTSAEARDVLKALFKELGLEHAFMQLRDAFSVPTDASIDTANDLLNVETSMTQAAREIIDELLDDRNLDLLE